MFKNSGLFKSGDGKVENGVEAEGVSPLTSLTEQEDANGHSAEAQVAPASLNQDELAKVHSLRSKMISASFGEIVTLLMRSPHYKHYSLSDLEWLVIPALLSNQFLVAETQAKPQQDSGQAEGTSIISPRLPVGLALWAKVSPEVDEKLSANLDAPVKLRPDEWRSGEINWIIDLLGDEKIMQSLYAKLKGDVFKGQTFKMRTQDKEGKRIVSQIDS